MFHCYILCYLKSQLTQTYRRALQVEAAGLAALRRTEEDCDVFRSIIKKIEDNMKADHVVFSQLDYDFHLVVVNSSKNILAIKLMKTFGELMRQQLLQIIIDLRVEDRSRTLKYHTLISNAIINKDEQLARRIMEEHLNVTYADIKKKEVIKFTL